MQKKKKKNANYLLPEISLLVRKQSECASNLISNFLKQALCKKNLLEVPLVSGQLLILDLHNKYSVCIGFL